MQEPPLFRPEVAEGRRSQLLGEILLASPPRLRWLSMGFSVLFVAVILFGSFATYTQRTPVSGVLMPSSGLIQLTAPQAGRMTSVLVQEGQYVAAKTVLFEGNSEIVSGGGSEIVAAAQEETRSRIRSIGESVARHEEVSRLTKKSSAAQLETLLQQAAALKKELATQRNSYALAEKIHRQYQEMAQGGYVTQVAVSEREQAVLDRLAAVQSTERALREVTQKHVEQSVQTQELEKRLEMERASLLRDASELREGWIGNEGRRSFQVRADRPAQVASIMVSAGKAVAAGMPLATLIPADDKLQAELVLPSNAVGFVRNGLPVKIRIDAYPYQKFGYLLGSVKAVTPAAMTPENVTFVSRERIESHEPVYRMVVELSAQQISAYGKPVKLMPGMTVTADVLRDTRSLFEWLLEPIVALKGHL